MTQQPSQHPGDDRTIAVLAHLSPVIALVVTGGWLGVLGPLLVWLVWRERGPLVRNASAGAFNFAIALWLLFLVAWVCIITIILLPLGLVLGLVTFVLQVVLSVRAALAANRGEMYRYPLQIRILS